MSFNVFYSRNLAKYVADAFEKKNFSNPDNIRKELNSIVGDITENQLKDFLADGLITTDSKLALLNAASMKSYWSHPFKQVTNETFYGDTPTVVEMMEITDKFYTGLFNQSIFFRLYDKVFII